MPDEPLDSALIARIAEGDEDAFRALYLRYQKDLINYLHKYTASRPAAEDIFQQTFLTAYTMIRAGRYREEGAFSSWLYRIAINHANRYLKRSKKVTLGLDRASGDEAGGGSIVDLVPAAGEQASEKASRSEDERLLLKAIAKLPEKYRRAILLHEIEGLKYKDIARALNIDITNVGVHLYRARLMLYDLLKGDMSPEPD